jgi:hypothetical protein
MIGIDASDCLQGGGHVCKERSEDLHAFSILRCIITNSLPSSRTTTRINLKFSTSKRLSEISITLHQDGRNEAEQRVGSSRPQRWQDYRPLRGARSAV